MTAEPRRRLRGAERDRVAAELRKRYETERVSVSALARETGRSYSTLWGLLQHANTEMRRRGGARRRREGDPERDLLAVQLAEQWQETPSVNALARRHGLSWRTVAGLLDHAGVQRPKRVLLPRPWTAAEEWELRRLAGKGWSVGRIGRRLRRTEFSIQAKIRQLRLPGRRTLVRNLDTVGRDQTGPSRTQRRDP